MKKLSTRLLCLMLVLTLLLSSMSSCRFIFGNKNNSSNNSTNQSTVVPNGNGNNNNNNPHSCSWTDIDELVEPTCTADGIVIYECTCGKKQFKILKAPGHDFGDWKVVTNAACDTFGEEERVCLNCDNKDTKSIDKIEHIYTVVEEEINQVLTRTYSCTLCDDTFSLASTLTENFEEIEAQRLSNCSNDFSFYVICGEDESYIRKNLRIFDAYYEGTEYENSENALCSYSLTETDENLWLVTPTKQYTPGDTYKAVRSGGVVFKDYGLKDLTFSIFKETTKIIEVNESLIFIQNLENRNPGYYPYTIDFSENSDTYWLTLKKIDGLKVGDVICVGPATNIDEVFGNINQKNTFGKIATMEYIESEKFYLVALDIPSMSEVFDKIDIYTSNIEDFGEIEINATDYTDNVVERLLTDEDFISFAGASYATTLEYLNERQLATPLSTFKEFLNSIHIDHGKSIGLNCNEDNILSAKTVIVGEISIPVMLDSSNPNSNIGTIVISFEACVSLDYLDFIILCNDNDKAKLSIWKLITNLKIGAEQSVTVSFNFNVEMSIEYSMDAKPYVYNLATDTYHFGGCKTVSSIKLGNRVWLYTEDFVAGIIEGGINTSKECKSCKPVSAITTDYFVLNQKSNTIHLYNCSHIKSVSPDNLTISELAYGNLLISGYTPCGTCKPQQRYSNSFSEKLLGKIESQDFGDSAEEIQAVAAEIRNSNTDSKIQIGEIPVTFGPCKVDFELYIYVDFKLEATLEYNYEVTIKNEYGVELKGIALRPYFTAPKKIEKSNCLTVIGKARFDVGALGIARATFIGWDDVIYVSLNAKLGLYAEIHGAMQKDFLNNNNSYAAAYFESGVHVEIYAEALIPVFVPDGGVFNIYAEDIPIWKLGYGKICYNYANLPEELVLDSIFFSLDRDVLMTVNSYDLVNMKKTTTRLNYLGNNGRYSVEYYLADGSNCYISNGTIIITNYKEKFTDQLTIKVVGYDTGSKYKKDNTYFTLPEITIDIVYDEILPEIVCTTIPEALDAPDGTRIEITGTVKFAGTWYPSYNNMRATIVDSYGNELYIYQLKTKVSLGDIVTIYGYITTYYDQREVAEGATAKIIGHDSSFEVKHVSTVSEVLSLPDYTNVIVIGTVTSIDTPYNSINDNISVTISDENGNSIYVHRLSGNVNIGDKIQITGFVYTYDGIKEIGGGATFEKLN